MEADGRRKWTLLSSHGHVLVEIARNPRARVRDISAVIGITERATQSIIADLERAGYVERVRIGRRTHYMLHPDNPFRHSAQDGLQVGPFLELLTAVDEARLPTVEETLLTAAALPLDGGVALPVEDGAALPAEGGAALPLDGTMIPVEPEIDVGARAGAGAGVPIAGAEPAVAIPLSTVPLPPDPLSAAPVSPTPLSPAPGVDAPDPEVV